MRSGIPCIAFAVLFVLLASPAQATLMTFEFEGVVDRIVDHGLVFYPDQVVPGDLVWGSCTIDTSVPDTRFPDLDYKSVFEGAVVSLSGTMGLAAFSLDDTGTTEIRIYNDAPIGPFGRNQDEFTVLADVILGQHSMEFSLGLWDSTAMALTDDLLPEALPTIDAFVRHHSYGFGSGDIGTFSGDLSSIMTVPEPGTWCFTALVFGLLAWRRRLS